MAKYLDINDIDQPVACYWWCRTWGSWGVAMYDANGDQCGEADWYRHKPDAVIAAYAMARENKCPVAQLRAA